MSFVSTRRATTLTRRMIARAAMPSPVAATLMALSLGAIAFLTACNTRAFNSDSGGLSKKSKGEKHSKGGESNAAMAQLSTPTELNIPIDEVSGLTVWPAPGSGANSERLMAVSDAGHTVGIGDVSKSGGGTFTKKDLKTVIETFGDKPGKASQWEALTSDAEGRVYVMNEQDGIVHVFSPDLSKVTNRVKLKVPKGHPLYEDWEADDNSRGEGLVLLGANHFLVAKEKDPAMLVEFGPEGDAPLGFTSQSRRRVSDGDFKLPTADRSEFVPLKMWPLDKAAKKILPDVSEATIGDDGALYLLGAQSRTIARVQGELGLDKEETSLDAWWPLPKAVSKPEGLVLLPSLRPAVAIDIPDADAKNLFLFEALR